jgi:hypothetical protein
MQSSPIMDSLFHDRRGLHDRRSQLVMSRVAKFAHAAPSRTAM